MPCNCLQEQGKSLPNRKDVDRYLHARALGRKLLVKGIVRVAQLVLSIGVPQRRVVSILDLADTCAAETAHQLQKSKRAGLDSQARVQGICIKIQLRRSMVQET